MPTSRRDRGNITRARNGPMRQSRNGAESGLYGVDSPVRNTDIYKAKSGVDEIVGQVLNSRSYDISHLVGMESRTKSCRCNTSMPGLADRAVLTGSRVKVYKALHQLSEGFPIYSEEDTTAGLVSCCVLVSSLRLKRPCLFHIRDTTAVTAPVNFADDGGSSQGEGMEAQATCNLFRPYTWRTLLDPWHFRRRPCPML